MTRGFSLLEFSVAMVIAGLVSTAAIMVFPTLNERVISLRNLTTIDAQMQPVLESVHADFQEVGGGGLDGGSGLRIYSRLGGSGGEVPNSDSVVLMSADLDEAPCSVSDYEADLRLTARRESGGVSSCCFDGTSGTGDINRLGAVGVGGAPRLVLLKRALGASCQVELREVFNDPATPGATSGALTVVSAKYLYVDAAQRQLVAATFEPGTVPTTATLDTHGPPDLGSVGVPRSRRVVAREVWDLQVATAAATVGERFLKESVDGVGDEWLGNAGGDPVPAMAPGQAYLRLGLIIGAPIRKGTTRTASLLDGPTRSDSGNSLFGAAINVFLRNGSAVR